MAYQLREGQGSLFPNDRKQEDRHPDYTGTILINGKEMSIAGWSKPRRGGKDFISVSISEKRERPQGQQQQASAPTRRPSTEGLPGKKSNAVAPEGETLPQDDDDVPFGG